jgi:hypothetical protein
MESHQFLQYLSATPPSSAGEAQQLEQFVSRHPWCGISHQLLLEAYYLNHDEKVRAYAPMAAVYAVTRHYLYQRLQQITPQEPAPPVVEPEPQTPEPPKAEAPEPAKKTLPAVPSGEYFNSSDLSLVDPGDDAIGRFIVEKPKISALSSSLAGVDGVDAAVSSVKAGSYAPEDMVTETLARIYADQNLYTHAIDIYEKLSLREPKKSAYFADLIQNLKNAKSKF